MSVSTIDILRKENADLRSALHLARGATNAWKVIAEHKGTEIDTLAAQIERHLATQAELRADIDLLEARCDELAVALQDAAPDFTLPERRRFPAPVVRPLHPED